MVTTVTVDIKNTANFTGAEVAQLYIGLPSEGGVPETPRRQLRGFQKLKLEPGQSKPAEFGLRRKDLSYWDTAAKKWVLPKGEFKIEVGSSSRDLRMVGSLVVT